MDVLIMKKMIITAAAVVVVLLLSHIIKKKAKEISVKKSLKKTRYFAIRRVVSFMTLFVLLFLIILIWGVNVKDLWVSIAGVLAMIAVAFFAIWSLIGNILAGFVIYFTSPFKVNDMIEILPDGIKGKVLGINTFFTLIADEEENYINIPNTLFFQKYIRNIRKK